MLPCTIMVRHNQILIALCQSFCWRRGWLKRISRRCTHWHGQSWPRCNELTENAGWDKRESIVGFSHTHLNGSGGGCKYGNILFMPTTGPVLPQDYASPFSGDTSRIGLFSTDLTDIIFLFISRPHVTQHSTNTPFQEDSQANVLMDMDKFLASYERQEFVDSEINILSDTEVEGFTRIRGIQSLTLNGKPYNKCWFRHSDIANGATLEFIMGENLQNGEPTENCLPHCQT
jgi:putative alpha-1,2-mannosidase